MRTPRQEYENYCDQVRKISASVIFGTTICQELCENMIKEEDRLEYEILDTHGKKKDLIATLEKQGADLKTIRQKLETALYP